MQKIYNTRSINLLEDFGKKLRPHGVQIAVVDGCSCCWFVVVLACGCWVFSAVTMVAVVFWIEFANRNYLGFASALLRLRGWVNSIIDH